MVDAPTRTIRTDKNLLRSKKILDAFCCLHFFFFGQSVFISIIEQTFWAYRPLPRSVTASPRRTSTSVRSNQRFQLGRVPLRSFASG